MNRFFRLCLLPAAAFALVACSTPVEFSASANPPSWNNDGDADFSGMDNAMSACKGAAERAGAGRCTQVRAYEACMKDKGYITVLGPENPPNCGQPDWEQDVRKWLE
ncbi:MULTISPECIES: hypothetical protein [unclassified Caballeronia]|uniref:hypothetical protein n=1 Tax=unclassified Caballeronia TaxID=2646786 RepID=UPI002028483E|nr:MULTISPECIES: hypothetical protein [unclassified Caballeronia]MDR5765233.1 hypothetical protein [Caballeronia sp. LZ028]